MDNAKKISEEILDYIFGLKKSRVNDPNKRNVTDLIDVMSIFFLVNHIIITCEIRFFFSRFFSFVRFLQSNNFGTIDPNLVLSVDLESL